MAAKMAVYYKNMKKNPLDWHTPGIRMQNADFADT